MTENKEEMVCIQMAHDGKSEKKIYRFVPLSSMPEEFQEVRRNIQAKRNKKHKK